MQYPLRRNEAHTLVLRGLLVAGVIWLSMAFLAAASNAVPGASLTLDRFASLPKDDLAAIAIATLNVAAADGLPGSEQVDRTVDRGTLDAWAPPASPFLATSRQEGRP